MARGQSAVWLAAMALASAVLSGGCLHAASKSTDSQATSTTASTTAPAPSATSTTTPPPPAATSSPEFGTLPPPPPPPDPTPPAGAVGTAEGWIDPSTPAQTASGQAPAAQAATALIPGYRIQIFASSERQRAESAAVDARQRFTEPVYVEFEAPLYKVRLGDCATRHEADTLKDKAGAQGYDGAWVAETQVRSH
ncbi:MAG TPA: SPOR domain-containing protein [Candidatus Udaeobacter sp.]|nr:SPOR domain-containing protein [Candidatus Udaeobacter sp.]